MRSSTHTANKQMHANAKLTSCTATPLSDEGKENPIKRGYHRVYSGLGEMDDWWKKLRNTQYWKQTTMNGQADKHWLRKETKEVHGEHWVTLLNKVRTWTCQVLSLAVQSNWNRRERISGSSRKETFKDLLWHLVVNWDIINRVCQKDPAEFF